MKRTSFVMQPGLALRALAVIIVMLTATTAWADDLPAKDAIIVNLAPLKFVNNDATVTDEEENQDLWSKLMKYKFWGTGEVVFDKAGVVIKEPSGYTGTAGKKIDLGGGQETSGAVVFNSNNYTLGGPIISGDDPQADKDLSVPELDESGITWESAVALTSAEAGEIQFIHVPPISKEDMKNEYLWFDKFIEGITFENGSGKTLYVLMPTNNHNANKRHGRLTRIFLRDGLTIKDAANDCKILVAYVNEEATWNSTTNSWDGLDLSKATIIDDKNYEGNLLFYTNADITFCQMNSNNVLLGTYMTSGSLTVNNHLNIAGQLIAGKRLLFNDAYDGRFQYMPFNAVHIRPDIPNIKSDANGNCEFFLYMNDDALTEVSFDYSFDFLSSEDPRSRVTRDGMGDNPTDETDAHFMPFTQEGKTRHMIIPQGSRKSDKIYVNVKPNVYLTNEVYMFLRISNLHGAALYGTAKDGEILLKVIPYGNKPPYFINPDKVILAVLENAKGAKAGTILANDDEGDAYTYAITGGAAMDLFNINPNSGVVTMKTGIDPFDYEAWKESGTKYTINVAVCDTRATTFSDDLCSEYTFPVSIIDVNEAPYFTNESNVISIAEGAAVSTDAITYDDPDKYNTGTFRNNELVITGGRNDLFEITADGFVKPKDGVAVKEAGEYKLEVRVQDANRDGNGNFIFPDLYEEKTFTVRYYTTGVDYMDWDDSQKKLVSKNTATDDNIANDKVWLLGGTETTLGARGISSAPTEAWYIAQGNVSFDHHIKNANFCNIHLILADGCAMTVGTEDEPITRYDAIYLRFASFTIYGQEKGTGSLTAVSSQNDGIFVENHNSYAFITINGGQVTAKGSSAIFVESTDHDNQTTGGIIINGGKVTANGSAHGIYASENGTNAKTTVTINGGEVYATSSHDTYYTIYGRDVIITGGHVEAKYNGYDGGAIRGNTLVKIIGGQVEAIGESHSEGIYTNFLDSEITLGWTDINDYILASKYDGYSCKVKIPAGRYFLVDGTTTVFGSATADYVFTDEELTAIAGKKLIPALPIATGGVDYIAFTNGIGNWTLLGDEAQVYAVTGYNLTAGLVYLKPIEGNVVPKGMPVVIGNKNEGTALPANIYLVGPDAQTKTVDGLLKGFVACDGSKTVQEYLDESFGEGVSASDYIPYLLKGGTFKAVLVNAADVIKQDICLLFIPKWDVLTGKSVGSTNATRSIGIGEGGETTRIRPPLTPPTQEGKGCAQWYDMQGRRIEKPTRKGLYIRNGVKVVIK